MSQPTTITNRAFVANVESRLGEDVRKRYFFEIIKPVLKNKFDEQFKVTNFKTHKGKTQKSEAKYMNVIKTTLTENHIQFTKQSSQRHIDLNSVGPYNIKIEVKKTDTNRIMLNDTIPRKGVFYVIILSKHEKVLFIEGDKLVENDQWYIEYKKKVDELKDFVKKHRSGCLDAYPRPNYSICVNRFLDTHC